MSGLFAIILSILAVFLILLVLVQRGRGGGLAGALGGMGGSSAFGAKAGDVFTRITIVAAGIWILICLIAVYWAGFRGDALGTAAPSSAGGPLDDVPPISTPAPKASTDTTAPAATAPAATAPAATEPAATEATPPAAPEEKK